MAKKRHAKVPLEKGAGDMNSILWCEREPLEAYAWAKKAWFAGESRETIWHRTGFPLWRLNSWIYGYDDKDLPAADRAGWKVLKEKMETEILRGAFRSNKERFMRVLDKSLTVLETGLDHLKAENAVLAPKDMSSVSTVVKTIFEMCQLEDNKPTSIVARGKLTIDQVRKKLDANDIIEPINPVVEKDTVVN